MVSSHPKTASPPATTQFAEIMHLTTSFFYSIENKAKPVLLTLQMLSLEKSKASVKEAVIKMQLNFASRTSNGTCSFVQKR